MADTATRSPSDRGVPPGLRVVTACAAVLVAYSYLFALWSVRHGESPGVLTAIRAWVNQPTGIGEDFGFLGTALLLLAAGHVVGGWSASGPRSLVVRLLRRGGPAPLCAAAIAGLLALAGLPPLLDPAITTALGALALFAALVPALGPLTRSAPGLAVLVELEVVCLLLLASGWAVAEGGPEWVRVLGLVAALVPLPVLGQVTRLVGDGRVPAVRGVALGVVSLLLLVAVDWLHPELVPYWRPLGATYALLLFLVALPRGAAPAATLPVRWLGDRAWPLFLSVPAVGYPVADALHPVLPPAVALVTGLVAAAATAEGLHRVEEGVA
ncbi:hypothetical protein [Saccharothrix longispora]|uniref:hypothetical protein n=1 Tax=Saccharothrix longispora TaxID=33920 RepID=UPI0028FD4750|nr:hypothetical protein [Saccharothrix longispora]MBY8850922.1 hypothetical protein [Saccharothrix sp. MB29]MDU0293451.1 hypothetical protein [Saccharothrix longispora]